jgi:PTS system nitrogen regulatory IIA component
MANSETENGLGALIERGGVYYRLQGNTPKEALTALIAAIPPRKAVQGETLLKAVLEREALMSTSIGHGIALPHPRNPVIIDPKEQFAALAFLERPVDWRALDGKPVDTLLLIVSSSARQHLETLSKVTFFCQEEGFLDLFKAHASQEEIIKFIKDTEEEWK